MRSSIVGKYEKAVAPLIDTLRASSIAAGPTEDGGKIELVLQGEDAKEIAKMLELFSQFADNQLASDEASRVLWRQSLFAVLAATFFTLMYWITA